jgi:mRNA-degrading endonuclease toxin of MazEF toxin-antitoxin module
LFQLRSVSEARLIKRIGKVTEEELSKIIEATKVVFGTY